MDVGQEFVLTKLSGYLFRRPYLGLAQQLDQANIFKTLVSFLSFQ